MKQANVLRLLGAAMIVSVSAAPVWAQTSQSPSADKPGATQQQTAPPSPAPSPPRATTADSSIHPMVGRNALSSDGNRVGDVRAVKTTPDGRVTAIQLKVGGFLGFGGRMVEVPEDKFTQKGIVIQIDYTIDEVDKLPDAQDNS